MKMIKSLPRGNGTPYPGILLCSLISIVLLTSCGSQRRLTADIQNSRDETRSNFIQTSDGQILEGETLKVKYPFFKKAYVEINQSEKVKLKDVIVLQNDEGYYRKIEGQLAPRIKKGGINTYVVYKTKQVYDAPSAGSNSMGRWKTETVAYYYLQKTDSGDVREMSPAVVSEFVSDYEPARAFMDEYYRTKRKVHTWSWINTAAVVGGVALMVTSADDESSSGIEPQGFVGLGLFLGGLVNGIVNKVHKGKNYKNMELAIDEYNRGHVKHTNTGKRK